MKDKILKPITWVAAIALILSVCALDSEGNLQYLIFGVSTLWCSLMVVVYWEEINEH